MNDYRMKANIQDFGNEQRPISEDPLEIYELLNKKKDKEVSKKQVSKDEDPTFPHGFTPNVVDDTVDGKLSGSNKQPNSDSHTSKDGFSGMNKGSNPSLNFKTGGSILQVMDDLVEVGQTMGYNMEGCLKNIEAIVETKLETIDLFAINALWGNFAFDCAISPSVGYSGGLLCVWDPNTFSKESVTISDSFLAIRGESVIFGDFNEVRAEHERFGLILVFPSLSALCLDRHLSDHRPILMRELVVDYGQSPFRVFHSWFSKDGFDKLVEDWCKEDNQRSKAARSAIQSCISDIDKFFGKGKGNEGLVIKRTSLLKDLQDINARYSLDLAQKAKIWWYIEGDENSKYFQGIIYKKRSQLAIHGVLVDGDWIEEPYKVKSEFLNHFTNRFSKHSGPKISFSLQMFKQLSDELKEILESNVTYEEIKKAIMDQDVVNAVHEFFNSSKFPPGCNFSFITLIPKNPDAKAFDSVRWDFLDDILNKFGFGAKWRGWIQRCLNSSMGSILVNGNPTSKFKFHKRLKQGDPLSPFLFILVMEGLHLSFNNILNARLFKGIRIDDSLSLSHLFYADDAIFIGVNLLKLMKKKVGNGVYTRFWDDAWLFDSLLMHVYPRLYALKCAKHVTVAAKLSDSSLIDSFRRPPRGGVEEEQLLGLIDNIDSVILSNSNDRWVWSLESSGEFSFKTARSHIDDFFLPSVGDPTRWIKIFPIKINIFAWKVRLDRLPTQINLSLREIDSPSIICPI
nr:hypothetical protein [Tanacetum cinerariifolium]